MKRILITTSMCICGAMTAILIGMVIGINITEDSPWADDLDFIRLAIFPSTIIALVLFWRLDRAD